MLFDELIQLGLKLSPRETQTAVMEARWPCGSGQSHTENRAQRVPDGGIEIDGIPLVASTTMDQRDNCNPNSNKWLHQHTGMYVAHLSNGAYVEITMWRYSG